MQEIIEKAKTYSDEELTRYKEHVTLELQLREGREKEQLDFLTKKLTSFYEDPVSGPNPYIVDPSTFIPDWLYYGEQDGMILKRLVRLYYHWGAVTWVQELISEIEDTQPPSVIQGGPSNTQQILAIYYLLIHAKLDFEKIDKTEVARFSQFITGRELGAKNIKNTNTYKVCRTLFNKGDRKNTTDLQIVRAQFENLGLHEIAELITKDMRS